MRSDPYLAQRLEKHAEGYLVKIREFLQLMSELSGIDAGFFKDSKIFKEHDNRNALGDKKQFEKIYNPYIDILNNQDFSAVQKINEMRKVANKNDPGSFDTPFIHTVIYRIDLTNKHGFYFDPPDKNLNETNHNMDYLILIATNIINAKQKVVDDKQQKHAAKSKSAPVAVTRDQVKPRAVQSAPAVAKKVKAKLSDQQMLERYGEHAQRYLDKLSEFVKIIADISQIKVGMLKDNKILKENDPRHLLGDRKQIAEEYTPYHAILENDKLNPVQKIQQMRSIAGQRQAALGEKPFIHTFIDRIDLTNKHKWHFDSPDKNLNEFSFNVDSMIEIAVRVRDAKLEVAAKLQRPRTAESAPATSHSSGLFGPGKRGAESAPVLGSKPSSKTRK